MDADDDVGDDTSNQFYFLLIHSSARAVSWKGDYSKWVPLKRSKDSFCKEKLRRKSKSKYTLHLHRKGNHILLYEGNKNNIRATAPKDTMKEE